MTIHRSPGASEGWPAGPPIAQPMPSSSPSNVALFAAVGCAAAAFMTLCAVGVGAVAWGVSRSDGSGGFASGGPTVRMRGQITSYMGSAAIGPGTPCDMPIEQVARPDGTSWCHVRLTCGGIPLYGSDENGFFPCTFSPTSGGIPGRVQGSDLETTSSDRDASFTVNSDLRTFEAHDDGAGAGGFFVVTGTITSIE